MASLGHFGEEERLWTRDAHFLVPRIKWLFLSNIFFSVVSSKCPFANWYRSVMEFSFVFETDEEKKACEVNF